MDTCAFTKAQEIAPLKSPYLHIKKAFHNKKGFTCKRCHF